MSLFVKLFRRAAVAASVSLAANAATAQQPPAPAPLDLPGMSNQDPVTPASWFGRGPF